MKPIDKMNLAECLESMRDWRNKYHGDEAIDLIADEKLDELADRISELTRWIPVSERMPTEEDGGLNNRVLVLEVEKQYPRNKYLELVDWFEIDKPDYYYTATHWKRIDKPEGV
jgi:hypothetical protein